MHDADGRCGLEPHRFLRLEGDSLSSDIERRGFAGRIGDVLARSGLDRLAGRREPDVDRDGVLVALPGAALVYARVRRFYIDNPKVRPLPPPQPVTIDPSEGVSL